MQPPAEAAGKTTKTRATSTLSGSLAGRHAKLHSAGSTAAYRLHATVRLVERRRDPIRNVSGLAAVPGEYAFRHPVQGKRWL